MPRVVCLLALVACRSSVQSMTVQQGASPERILVVGSIEAAAVEPGRCTPGGSVAIVGAVKAPGRYACAPGMRLASLVAAARGLERELEPNAIKVRHGQIVYRIAYDGTIDEADLPDVALTDDDFVEIDVPGQ